MRKQKVTLNAAAMSITIRNHSFTSHVIEAPNEVKDLFSLPERHMPQPQNAQHYMHL